MCNITIISTNHTERGKCNSDELYKIIKSINPEVIFEELPISLFNIVYNGNLPTLPFDAPLELKCVKKYLQDHYTKHFPVDIDSNPNLSEDENFMFSTFAKNEDYKKLESEYYLILTKEGFDFLNSNEYLDLLERKSSLERRILESATHHKKLLDTYKIFYEKIDKRENAMLQNIYNYCIENQFNRAAFLLGSGHRKSITKKILLYEEQSEIKLNWKIFNRK